MSAIRFFHSSRRCSQFLLATILLLAASIPAAAQSEGQLRLVGIDTRQFPDVVFFLRAEKSDGSFLSGLTPAGLSAIENGRAQSVKSLEEFQPGVQMIFALNLSEELAKKAGQETLYEKVAGGLDDWLENRPEESPDDYSLVSNTGLQLVHERSPRKTAGHLAALHPDLKQAQSNLLTLAQALDLAADPSPNPYMERVILFVTALPQPQAEIPIKNLTARAGQLGVHLFVWLVGPPKSASTPTGEALAELAFSTGGQLFSFSGAETLPNPETYFAPLRQMYRGVYPSSIRSGGVQNLAIETTSSGTHLESAPLAFTLTLAAPNPIFLSPPARIERTWVQGKNGEQALTPDAAEISILVEFDDGHPRPISLAQLLVDGRVVAENTAPPFDRFTWPLSDLTESGRHLLKVHVEDRLGFSQTSVELPVDVFVQVRPVRSWLDEGRRERLFVGAAVLAAALALTVILILTGSRGLRSKTSPGRRRRLHKDPVSQPVPIRQDAASKRASTPVATWPRVSLSASVPAALIKLDASGEPEPSAMVPLSRSELIFGSDPRQAICVLNDSSVSPLHATLIQDPGGGFRLKDAGSIAGTWVNDQPVDAGGMVLAHGDLVNFGRVVYRFELSDPGALPSPKIRVLAEEQP